MLGKGGLRVLGYLDGGCGRGNWRTTSRKLGAGPRQDWGYWEDQQGRTGDSWGAPRAELGRSYWKSTGEDALGELGSLGGRTGSTGEPGLENRLLEKEGLGELGW